MFSNITRYSSIFIVWNSEKFTYKQWLHADLFIHHFYIFFKSSIYRAAFRFAPSQWETVLLCSDVSPWLGASWNKHWLTYLCRIDSQQERFQSNTVSQVNSQERPGLVSGLDIGTCLFIAINCMNGWICCAVGIPPCRFVEGKVICLFTVYYIKESFLRVWHLIFPKH